MGEWEFGAAYRTKVENDVERKIEELRSLIWLDECSLEDAKEMIRKASELAEKLAEKLVERDEEEFEKFRLGQEGDDVSGDVIEEKSHAAVETRKMKNKSPGTIRREDLKEKKKAEKQAVKVKEALEAKLAEELKLAGEKRFAKEKKLAEQKSQKLKALAKAKVAKQGNYFKALSMDFDA